MENIYICVFINVYNCDTLFIITFNITQFPSFTIW